MLFWFATLGLGGLVQILQAPEVLAALDPRHALGAMARGGVRSAFLLGGVILAVTGVEALYADMGIGTRL
jgi:KUP system potassium uptake protein